MDTHPWDVLLTYHWEVVGCFIWDLFETSWRRTDGTPCYFLLRWSHGVPIRCPEEVPPRILGRRSGLVLKTGLPLMESILKISAKRVLIPLGLTAAAAATDAAIQKKLFWSGMRLLDLGKGTTLTVSNEEMDDILTQWMISWL